MSQEDTVEPTYTKNREVATWHYKVESCPSGVSLAPWLADLVAHILDATDGFAEIDSLDVSTHSKGEDSFAIDLDTAENRKQLDLFLRSTPDVTEINAWLSLKCTQIDANGLPEEFLIHNNGWLSLGINTPRLVMAGHGVISVSFNFESDIYSPIARGDNRKLAALNTPRLRKFLRNLSEISPLKFDYIDDPVGHIKRARKYGVVDDCGFKMPDVSSAFEEIFPKT